MANRPVPVSGEEGSKGGERSVIIFAIVAACLTVLLILVGTGHITGSKVAAPPPSAETPANTNP
jgi:hypothetical protein